MAAKKGPVDISSAQRYRTTLQSLYARRSAIDNLIESLKDYEKYRARRIEACKLKTA